MRKDYEIRKEWIWESQSKQHQPIGKIFTDALLCKYHPDPLKSLDALQEEWNLMFSDVRKLINSHSKENI